MTQAVAGGSARFHRVMQIGGGCVAKLTMGVNLVGRKWEERLADLCGGWNRVGPKSGRPSGGPGCALRDRRVAVARLPPACEGGSVRCKRPAYCFARFPFLIFQAPGQLQRRTASQTSPSSVPL